MSATDRTLLLQLFNEAKETDFPGLSDSDFFEVFVPYHHLKNYDLDYNDIENGIVDGPQDGGIDAIYCLCDGRLVSEIDQTIVRRGADVQLYIFSTKFIDSFKVNAINNIRSTLVDLCTLDDESFDSTSKHYNEEVVLSFTEFREFYRRVASKFPNLSIKVIYVTASSNPANTEVISKLSVIENSLKDQFSSAIVTASAVDARGLLDKVRQHPEEVRPLEISGNSINITRGPSYISLVRLGDYYSFVCKPDGSIETRLFEDNVRDYEGDVEVNREISGSLASQDGPDFWWLNNGVSIICESATLSGSTLQIRNPKIVNGLQTSRQIYKHFSAKENKSDNRMVLVRVISANDESIRSSIIRATNRQTPILPAQLVATSALHRDIELYLRGKGLYYERRKNFWKNQNKKRSEIVSITDIAQAVVTTVDGRPHVARARPGSILKESTDNNVVFNDAYDPKIYQLAIELVRSTDALIQDALPNCGRRDRNNIKFHAVAKIVSESTGGNFNPTVFLNIKPVEPSVRLQIINKTFELYTALGSTDAVAKSEDFWLKLKSEKI